MKKKLIIGVLALSMCFAMSSCDVINGFFGNNSSTSSTTESEYDVAGAAEVLYDSLVDKDEETRVDYTVPHSISYLKNVYTITWSVNVTEDVVSLKKGDTETTVVVNKNAQTDIEYKLTAVVSDPNGKTETIEFERKVLHAPAYTPEAITAKPVENQAYKLYVYQSTSKIDCYFKGLMSGYYFATSEDYTEGVEVYVEYVEGSTDLFNLYFDHVTDGKQYIGVEISGTHSNAVFKSSPVSQFSYSTQYNTIITNVQGTDYYLGNYSSYNTIQASAVSHASSSNVGGLVEMIDKNNIAPEKKVATVKESLSVQAEHRMNKEIELPSYDERFADVTIEWALAETTAATLSEGKLALTIPAAETSVTLTATIKCGEKSDTKEFTLKLGPAIVLGNNPTEAEIVNAAFSLATNEALDGEFTLTGKITKIKTAYSEQYGNITVIISTNDKEIECFRLKGTGADALKVGDTIQVKGTLKNYNGTVEFDSDCALLSVSADQGGTDTPADDTAPATQNTADFNTLTMNTKYQSYTTTNGWTATNAQVLTYGTANNNGKFDMYETEGTNAVCLNGKTSALGTLVSPTFTGGIKKLSFNYGFAATDTQFSIIINVKDANGTVVATKTLEKTGLAKYTKYDYVWTLETAVEGNFTIEIKNNGLSNQNSNKDRLSIWNLAWNSVSASGATIVGGTENPDEGGEETPSLSVVTAPAVGTAYKFAMVQANKNNTVYYLAGGMNSYYMATTDDASKALDFYLETTEGGYYLYCYVGNVKTYVNCVTSNGHVNGAYETTASTVYTIDETGLLTTTIDEKSYAFGTRNDNTYTTVGPVAESYNGFHCYFYGAANA